jgi:hypothetical protein
MPTPRRQPIAALASLLAAALVGAGLSCAGAPRTRPEPKPVVLPERAPLDFTLGVTVLEPTGGRGPRQATPIDERPLAERPARYIVEPDGVLRVALGAGVNPRVFPRQTRQLTADQMQRLWRLTVDTQLHAPETLTRIDNTETFFPHRSRPTALVYVKRDGVATHHAVRLPVGDAESAALTRLITELARLAWVPE